MRRDHRAFIRAPQLASYAVGHHSWILTLSRAFEGRIVRPDHRLNAGTCAQDRPAGGGVRVVRAVRSSRCQHSRRFGQHRDPTRTAVTRVDKRDKFDPTRSSRATSCRNTHGRTRNTLPPAQRRLNAPSAKMLPPAHPGGEQEAAATAVQPTDVFSGSVAAASCFV